MANLEIRFPSQPVERRALSKNQPLLIGRSLTSDVHIDDDSVASMHCRISWNRDAYEVSAAGGDGIDLNGTLVRRSMLKPGDLLRVGPVDIFYREGDSPASDSRSERRADPSVEIELKPVTEDGLEAMRRAADSPWVAAVQTKSTSGPAPRDSLDDRGKSDEGSSSRSRSERKSSQRTPENRATEPVSAAGDDDARGIVLSRNRSQEEEAGLDSPSQSSKKSKENIFGRRKPVRPGEEDTIRSPIVLGLLVSSIVLLLLGAVFYFVIGRDSAQRAFELAQGEFEQGKYTQAIELFEKFYATYPRHVMAEEALDYLWAARVEKEISGGSPAWKSGLDRLREAVDSSRDRTKSPDRDETFRRQAEKIVLGAGESATRNPMAAAKPRDLLAVSNDAQKLVLRFTPDGRIPEDKAAAMAQTLERAEAAIIKQETFDAHVAEIEQALKDLKPMVALDARLKLLALHPDFETHKKITALLAATLETERDLVTREELEKDAVVEDRQAATPAPLTFAMHTRARTDEQSTGRTVFALASDCCYGIDSVTGEPVWRRVIGLDTPFFPVAVTTSVPGLLLFDTRFEELAAVDQRTGKLLWRQPLGEPMSGAPLVHEGQIYAPTLGNNLYKIDLETGRMTTRLTFSQKTYSPPALVSNGERLVVAGERALFYTLTTRPLACLRVDYTAHRAGDVQAPLVTMGSLVLAAMGQSGDNSKLRILDVRSDEAWLKEVAVADIIGQMRDAPVIRGKELFVPSSGERITAFTVTDDPGQRPLTQVATLQVQTPFPGPMFLSPGPDGQLWFSGSAIRKLQLKTESIKLDPAEIAAGTSTQPLQNISQYLYAGRKLPYSNAVLFTQADRDSMSGLWRTVLGSRVLAVVPVKDGGIISVTEGGEVYLVSGGELAQGGFKRASSTQLKVPPDLTEPMRASVLSDGRIAVDCAGSQPQLWIIGPTGQVDRQVTLEKPLEAAPVLLGAGVVLPLPGRLRLLKGDSGTGVEDYIATVDKEIATKWKFVAAIDETDLIAVNDQGKLTRVQFRTTPVAHLAEVATRTLVAPVDVALGVREDRLYLAGADSSLQQLDAASLETLSEVRLEAPASFPPAIIGDRLFIESGNARLNAFSISEHLKPLWTFPLDGSGLSGPPARFGNLLVISQRDGIVTAIDPTTGESSAKIDVGQPLVLGPQTIESVLVATTIDGSLVRVESKMTSQP